MQCKNIAIQIIQKKATDLNKLLVLSRASRDECKRIKNCIDHTARYVIISWRERLKYEEMKLKKIIACQELVHI